MKTLLLCIGRFGLVLTIMPAVFLLMGMGTLSVVKLLMAVGMLLWFVSAPIAQRIDS